MEKSCLPGRTVKVMESTGRRNVCVRGRISIWSVGAGPGWKSRELEVKVEPETGQGRRVVTTV